MHYVISDIHGCYEQYMALLKEIHFSEEDTLYVLGDVVDRGPEPIKVLQDMIKRKSVVFIIGNHDYLMYIVMKNVIASIKNHEVLTEEIGQAYKFWVEDGGNNGGEVT